MGNISILNTAYPDVTVNICPKIFRKQDNSSKILNLTGDQIKVKSQALASRYIFYSTLGYSIPSIFLTLYIGPWSDKYGRDKPIMLPFIGALCQAAINSCISSFYQITVHYIIIGSVINGLSGGMAIEMLGLFSYLSHYSDKEERTIKFAILEAFGLTGILFGTLLSGILLKILLLKYVFIIIFLINTSGLCYTLAHMFLNKIKLPYYLYKGKTRSNVCKYSWIWQLITPIIKNPQLKKIILVCLTINILMFVTIGEFETMYLFVALRFDWPANLYGYFLAVWKAGEIFALITILPLLKKFSCGDMPIAILGLVSKIFGLILLGFSSSTYIVFIAGIISLMDSTPSITLRSTISQTVENKDLGKLFALIAVTEAITTIVSSLVNTQLYSYSLTIKYFGGNGMVYFIGAIFLTLAIGIITYVHRLDKRNYDPTSSKGDVAVEVVMANDIKAIA